MLYESHLEDNAQDADALDIQFDDLEGASRAKSAQDQMRILRMSCSGVPLAYHLMSSMLLQLVEIFYVVTFAAHCR